MRLSFGQLRQEGQIPDAVILDDMLGEAESGLSLAQWLAEEIGAERILLISGNTDPIRLAQTTRSGFRLPVKPVAPDTLYARLREIAGLTRTMGGAPTAADSH